MYFPLQIGDVVIRKCNGQCERVPTGWAHLNKDKNDDAIFRMVTETQPNINRAQRRAAARHKHVWSKKSNGKSVCDGCGATKDG